MRVIRYKVFERLDVLVVLRGFCWVGVKVMLISGLLDLSTGDQ